MKKLTVILAIIPGFALAQPEPQNYALICTSPCETIDGNGNTISEGAGYVKDVIIWDGVTSYNSGVGYELRVDADGSIQIGQTVTP